MSWRQMVALNSLLLQLDNFSQTGEFTTDYHQLPSLTATAAPK